MPAFEAAWASGVGWIEADVQPTHDTVPVLLHDEDLARTTNGRGPIRFLSWADIAGLDAGSWFTTDATGNTRAYAQTPIPRLADVVGTLGPHRALLLEIKGEHTRDQVLAEMDVVRSSGWDDRVFLESFEVQVLQHIRSIDPDRPVGMLVHVLHEDPVAVCTEIGAVAYNPDWVALRERPELVKDLHAAGLATFVYTVDDPADWAVLTDLGVDGIITNRPGELVAWQHEQSESARGDRRLELSGEL